MFLKSFVPGEGFRLLDSVKISSEMEIKSMVAKARNTFLMWSKLDLDERIEKLLILYSIYSTRKMQLAELQSIEIGKPILESIADVESDLDYIHGQIRIAKEALAHQVFTDSNQKSIQVHFEPFGVIAALLSWNFPLNNFFTASIQAILAGNCVIVKHSELCPITCLEIEKMFQDASFPDGVVQFVYGGAKEGKCLVNQKIDLLYFTGRTSVGKYLYRKAAKNFIPVTFELEGSAPALVLEDADLQLAVDKIVMERFTNCGQTCTGIKRVFIHKNLFPKVLTMIEEKLENFVIGLPQNKLTTLGPLASRSIKKKLKDQLDISISQGAKLIYQINPQPELKGAYFSPTILTNITESMPVFYEETFGPILPIIPFTKLDNAIKMANNSQFGLSAYIFTSDKNKAMEISKKIDVGCIGVNDSSFYTEYSPINGRKKSGIGIIGGVFGFRALSKIKTIGVRI